MKTLIFLLLLVGSPAWAYVGVPIGEKVDYKIGDFVWRKVSGDDSLVRMFTIECTARKWGFTQLTTIPNASATTFLINSLLQTNDDYDCVVIAKDDNQQELGRSNVFVINVRGRWVTRLK